MFEQSKNAICWGRALVAIAACFAVLACARPHVDPVREAIKAGRHAADDPVRIERMMFRASGWVDPIERYEARSAAITFCETNPETFQACLARYDYGTCGSDAECAAFYGGEY